MPHFTPENEELCPEPTLTGGMGDVVGMGDVGAESSEKGKGSKSEYGMGDIL